MKEKHFQSLKISSWLVWIMVFFFFFKASFFFGEVLWEWEIIYQGKLEVFSRLWLPHKGILLRDTCIICSWEQSPASSFALLLACRGVSGYVKLAWKGPVRVVITNTNPTPWEKGSQSEEHLQTDVSGVRSL